MRHPTTRVTHLTISDRRGDLLAVLDHIVPKANKANKAVEDAALYVLVVLFWGLLLYFALQSF